MDRTDLGQCPAWRNIILCHIQCEFFTIVVMKSAVLCCIINHGNPRSSWPVEGPLRMETDF
jgi:hypothetical protein